MLFRVNRNFGDYINGMQFQYGTYVETDCLNWANRMGSFLLTPLAENEEPKAGILIVKVSFATEDSVVKEAVIPNITADTDDSEQFDESGEESDESKKSDDSEQSDESGKSGEESDPVVKRKIKPQLKRKVD